MPYRPKVPCKQPGCAALVEPGKQARSEKAAQAAVSGSFAADSQQRRLPGCVYLLHNPKRQSLKGDAGDGCR